MSNFIQVTDRYALASDSLQWMIQKSKNVKNIDTGEVDKKWISISFFSSFDNAVKHLGQHLLRNAGANTFNELQEAANEITETLKNLPKINKQID